MIFYSGMENGRVILTPEFAASLTRAGFPPSPIIKVAPMKGYAMDSAPDEDPLDHYLDYGELNRAYERLLQDDGQPPFTPTLTNDDFEGRAASTRGDAAAVRQGFSATDPAAEDAALRRFKAARGWDSVDRVTENEFRQNYRLEAAYAEMLLENQPLEPWRAEKGGLQ